MLLYLGSCFCIRRLPGSPLRFNLCAFAPLRHARIATRSVAGGSLREIFSLWLRFRLQNYYDCDVGALLQHSNTPTPQHPNTPTLQHSNTPTLQHSNTPTLQHSNTPTLRHSSTPVLHHSARPDSRTACPTKPMLYVANRSKSASQARRAPQPGRWRSRKDDDENENEACFVPFASHFTLLGYFTWRV